VPLDASTLNTGAASSRPPVKTKIPAAFISATSARFDTDTTSRPRQRPADGQIGALESRQIRFVR
jgi:hypothetical protein